MHHGFTLRIFQTTVLMHNDTLVEQETRQELKIGLSQNRTALVAACRRDSASSWASSALCDFSAALRRRSPALALASFSCFSSSFARSLAALYSVSAAFASLCARRRQFK